MVSPAPARRSCNGVGGQVALRKWRVSASAAAARTGIMSRAASHALMTPRLDQLAAKQ
jgi:hypothetical protein